MSRFPAYVYDAAFLKDRRYRMNWHPAIPGGAMIRKNIRRIAALKEIAAFRTCFAVVFAYGFLYLTVCPANAQLGPKDGANLPPTDLERVRVGDIAPDFTLQNLDGQGITLSQVYRDRNVVLVFYRGQW